MTKRKIFLRYRVQLMYNLFMETKTLSLKTRLFLAFEQEKATEIQSHIVAGIALATKMRLTIALRETNRKINLLEQGKISEYLGYN